MGDNIYDLVFIDGDHPKDGAIADFVGIYPFVSPQSIIVFHDGGGHEGVRGAIEEIVHRFGIEFKHCMWHGEFYRNGQGTSFFYRGFGNSDTSKFCRSRKQGVACGSS